MNQWTASTITELVVDSAAASNERPAVGVIAPRSPQYKYAIPLSPIVEENSEGALSTDRGNTEQSMTTASQETPSDSQEFFESYLSSLPITDDTHYLRDYVLGSKSAKLLTEWLENTRDSIFLWEKYEDEKEFDALALEKCEVKQRLILKNIVELDDPHNYALANFYLGRTLSELGQHTDNVEKLEESEKCLGKAVKELTPNHPKYARAKDYHDVTVHALDLHARTVKQMKNEPDPYIGMSFSDADTPPGEEDLGVDPWVYETGNTGTDTTRQQRSSAQSDLPGGR